MLVTGAGSGIGQAAAVSFASHGARVVVADIDAQGGESTVAQMRASAGEATFVRADVSVDQDVADMVAQAVAKYGRLDVAFNNAGVTQNPLPLAEQASDTYE